MCLQPFDHAVIRLISPDYPFENIHRFFHQIEVGLVVGGNYGCLAGEVFRIGHMGTQANLNLVKEAMDIFCET